jgi:hypothetical protein
VCYLVRLEVKAALARVLASLGGPTFDSALKEYLQALARLKDCQARGGGAMLRGASGVKEWIASVVLDLAEGIDAAGDWLMQNQDKVCSFNAALTGAAIGALTASTGNVGGGFLAGKAAADEAEKACNQ